MIKYWKKILLSVCILIVISLCVSIVITKQSTKNDLNFISSIDVVSNDIVLINTLDDKFIVTKMDNQGNEISSIYYPIKKNQIYNNCLDLITIDNKVYIHLIMLNSSNGTIFKEKVLLCDFDNNSLVEKWEIPTNSTDFEQVAFGTTIINDNLYYISFNDDTTANLNRMDNLGNYSIEKTISLEEYNIIDWAIFEDLSIIGYSSYQGIIDFSNDISKRIYPIVEENSSLVNFDYTSDGTVYLTDLYTNQNIIYDLNTNTLEYSPITKYNVKKDLNKNILEASCLKKISYVNNNEFVSICDYNQDYNSIAIYKNGNLSIIDQINTKNLDMKFFSKYFGICFLICAIIVLLISSYIYFEKYISITLKISMLSGIILVIGISFILNNIKLTLQDNLKNDMYSILLNNVSLSQYDLEMALYDGYDYNLIDKIINIENFTDLKDRNIRENNLVMSPYCNLHILNENGTLMTMNNKGGMENIPTEYIYDKSIVEKYIQSINDNTAIVMTQKDSLGEWYILGYPIIIECSDGTTINAILETGIEKYIVNNDIYKYYNTLAILLIASLMTLIIITMIILWISLKPLKTLTYNIKNNNIDFKGNRKNFYKDEIIEIKEIFEQMIANITNYKQEMENNSNTYQKFLPYQIFNTLSSSDNESILQLELGDSKKMFLYNIYMDFNICPKDNLFYNNVISNIENNHGVVESFNLKFMEVLFWNNPKDMLNTIIDLIHQYDGLYAGFSYGISIPAIIGGNSRLETIVISKQKKVSEILCKICKKFNTKLIVSEYLLKQISNYEDYYSIRLIGHINLDGNYIKIYEVLDVSSRLEINLTTKVDFENGIECFLNNDFATAKKYFVRVLKHNKDDDISKEYLNMCDIYLSKSNKYCTTDILYNKRSE